MIYDTFGKKVGSNGAIVIVLENLKGWPVVKLDGRSAKKSSRLHGQADIIIVITCMRTVFLLQMSAVFTESVLSICGPCRYKVVRHRSFNRSTSDIITITITPKFL